MHSPDQSTSHSSSKGSPWQIGVLLCACFSLLAANNVDVQYTGNSHGSAHMDSKLAAATLPPGAFDSSELFILTTTPYPSELVCRDLPVVEGELESAIESTRLDASRTCNV